MPLVRWEPTQPVKNRVLLRQSIFVHVLYYSSFICGHRAHLHIPSSLISSVRAGQACINILAEANVLGEGESLAFLFYANGLADLTRTDDGGYWNGLSLFASAYCIQLGIWSARPELNDKSELASSITTSLSVLSKLEHNWIRASKYMCVDGTFSSIMPH